MWNNIDKRITKYHVEAADNAKFLGAIEKTSHSIYLEDPGQVRNWKLEGITVVTKFCLDTKWSSLFSDERVVDEGVAHREDDLQRVTPLQHAGKSGFASR